MSKKILEKLDKYPIQKKLKKTFGKINDFESLTVCKCKIEDSNVDEHCNLKSSTNKHEITFQTNENYWEKQNKLINIYLSTSKNTYICENSLITYVSYGKNLTYKISLSNIKIGKPSYYFRLLLPNENKLDLFSLFETTGYRSEFGITVGLMVVTVNNLNFHVYELKDYLIIDCIDKFNYDSFYESTLYILLALGILTGSFVQNKCYIISSDDINYESISYFEFRPLRETKKTPYKILPTNPYTFFCSDIAESKREYMAHISKNQFDNFIKKISESKILLNALFVFVESYDYPLDTKPVCLSVVLEGLYQFLNEKIQDQFKPIKDKDKEKELINKIKELLPQFESSFTVPDGESTLLNRINDLNKTSNSAGFQKLFELFNYKLKDHEKETLKNRNSFLHCNEKIYQKYIIVQNGSDEYLKIFFTEENLTKLLYILILKIIDYSGYIVNILKFNEDVFGTIKKEDLLIKI